MAKKESDKKNYNDEKILRQLEEDSKHRKSALLKILENTKIKSKN